MAKAIQVTILKKDAKTCVVRLSGRIDSETSRDCEALLEPIAGKGFKKVLIDMSGVDYVSSAGIRVFFDLRKKVKAKLGEVSFFRLQPQIHKVFEIVKALPLECIFSDESEADAYLERLMNEELKKKSS